MAIPADIQAKLDAADALNPPRGLISGPANLSLLATVREAVYGVTPRQADAAAAATAPASPPQPAAAPGSHGTIDPARAAPIPTAPTEETIDWDAVVASMNAKAGLQSGSNPQAIYGQRRATAGQPSATEASPSHSRSGIDPVAVYASRREQAAASGTIDWDAIVAAENAKLPPGAIIPGAARSSGLDASAVYGARHAQTDAGGAGPGRASVDHDGPVPKLNADPARTASFRTAYQTYAVRRAQTGEHP